MNGLMMLFRYGKWQPWVSARSRKTAACVLCRQEIVKGSAVFRPLGNQMNRYERAHAACVETRASYEPQKCRKAPAEVPF